jgi:dTDP-4-dehydrorhamnose reductase
VSGTAILVTGGGGRLARALAAADPARVRAPPRARLDVTDAGAVAAALAEHAPAAVINAAADSSADCGEEARPVNAIAPGVLARACRAAGTPLIHISTDYVFGAATVRPWREDDPVSPVNRYGALKAEGEAAALGAGGRVCVARVAWLFGDGGDFIARILATAGPGDGVAVVEDQVGSPTPIAPLAERLLRLADRVAAGAPTPPILHLAGSPPVSRADWAEAAFEGLGRAGRPTPTLVRRPLESFSWAAPRPRFSALDCSRAEALFGSPLDWRPATADPATFLGPAQR